MIAAACAFFLFTLIPMNFDYVEFGLILMLMAWPWACSPPPPGRVINALPPEQRGAGRG